MIECLLLGDDLALGLSYSKPECALVAKPYITSQMWVDTNIELIAPSKITVISLMTYDDPSIPSIQNLEKIRQRVKTGKVFWIVPIAVPSSLDLKGDLEKLAKKYGDTILKVPPKYISKSRIHPTDEGYDKLSKEIK